MKHISGAPRPTNALPAPYKHRASHEGELIMAINTDRIDEAVLALLYLGLHDHGRAWKGFDWDAMNRLHEKGMISNPVSKAKSVVLTEEGEREAERLFNKLFTDEQP
jgi:hypothetical protein